MRGEQVVYTLVPNSRTIMEHGDINDNPEEVQDVLKALALMI